MSLRRITITIPGPLLAAADERSRALERSRSWVVVDALRRYLAEDSGELDRTAHGDRRAVGLGPYRLAQLESDLGLPIRERVRESELAARVTELRTTPIRSQRVLTFDRYEEYLEWERWEERAR